MNLADIRVSTLSPVSVSGLPHLTSRSNLIERTTTSPTIYFRYPACEITLKHTHPRIDRAEGCRPLSLPVHELFPVLLRRAAVHELPTPQQPHPFCLLNSLPQKTHPATEWLRFPAMDRGRQVHGHGSSGHDR